MENTNKNILEQNKRMLIKIIVELLKEGNEVIQPINEPNSNEIITITRDREIYKVGVDTTSIMTSIEFTRLY